MARILIVDDVATNRDYLRTLLEYKGHRLLEAGDGAEALAVARSARPDLIITDILMPTMDGYEFVRQLRLDPQIAGITVVFCTADYHERAAQNLATACGVAQVLTKPCAPELVLSTVDSALGLATGPAAAAEPAPTPPADQFEQDHLRLLTDKLSAKAGELHSVNRRLGALIDVSLQLSSESDPPRLLERLCRSARDLVGARYAAIAAGTGTGTVPDCFFTSGIDSGTAQRMRAPALAHGTLGAVFTGRGTQRLRATSGAALTPVALPHFPAAECLLGAPISSPNRSYGWLCFGDKIGGEEFTEEDERLVTILGAQAGRMYENARLYANAQRHAKELRREAVERRGAQAKLQAQLNRLDLLHRITRAVGERRDLASIFQVVIRSLEDDLPIDFGCISLYEPMDRTLTVTVVGVRSGALGRELSITENTRIPIDPSGLSGCVKGQLLYEPNVRQVPFELPQRLAHVGLQALVATPLLAESKVFGILITARHRAEAFSSGDCEFLRQLGDHVALAAHQAQLYAALQQAYEDLHTSHQAVMQQERLSALGQIASGVAHDINNAISPISLYTESLLEQEPGLSPRARTYLETIQRAIDDVARTVNRMRDFYRPRDEQLAAASVALNQIVQQVVEFTRVRWRDMSQARGIVVELRQDLEENLPAIAGIEGELRDALTNLVFNAVDALPEGGGITIRTRTSTGAVRLEVCDTGVGMDEHTRRRCLEPFFTTKGERGTGLGLAMVYGMAQRHGADTEIESARGKGTTIRLTFPVHAAAADGAESGSSQLPQKGLSVLVVDDDPLVLAAIRLTLENDGHMVTALDNGQAGIDAFVQALQRNQPFAVVITDLGMPNVDGRKVAAAVKAIAPAIPVIMLTGWAQQMSAHDDMPPHVDRLLGKPPRLGALRNALAGVLANPGNHQQLT